MAEEKPEKKKRLYCAIYTRKSTSEGLDQDFTSLDAQREAGENYIKSQQNEGWVVLNEQYNDGGFTGANIERPALQKLLNDIKEKKIDCVVVYKVDRLSRSLLDFSQLLEFFDKNGVAFVSVTQQFNTNTSMGRLTLNILLSFAQFEREIISERTKDKMGAARRRGQWLGGRPPYGYRMDEATKKLIVEPEEVKNIKTIFELYLKGNSVLKTAQIINQEGIATRPWTSKSGTVYGNKKFSSTRIIFILKNVVYTGKVHYAGQIFPGQQPAIIDDDTFAKVQIVMAQNRVERKPLKNTDCSGLLTHLLKCKTCASMMFHTYTLKKRTHKYRYYVCTNAQKRGYSSCPNRSINAQSLEESVIIRLKEVLLENRRKNGGQSKEAEAFLSPVWDSLFPTEKRKILKSILREVDCDVKAKKIGLLFHDSPVRLEFEADVKKSQGQQRWHKEKEITKEPKIRKSLLLAHQLQRLLDQNKIQNVQRAAEWLNISQSRLDHTLNLLLLSPTIQTEIIFEENRIIDLIPEYKVRSLATESSWDKQADLWLEIKNSLPKN